MFQVISENHCAAKILLAIWETFYANIIIIVIPENLVTSSLISLFCPLKQKTKAF